MLHRICQYCNQPFDTTSGTKKYCNREHYAVCKICGNQFILKYNELSSCDRPTTCSKKCRAELRKATCVKKYGAVAPAGSIEIQNKIKATNIKRYGAVAPACNKDIQEKIKATNRAKYGVDYGLQSEEIKAKAQATNIEKYGVANVLQSSEIREKIKSTNIEKYGVANVFQSEEMRQKWSDNYFAKTGYRHHWANPEIIAKSESTWQAKYGHDVKRPLQSAEVMQRVIATNMERYGAPCSLQGEEVRKKSEQTNLAKYGVKHVFQSPEIRARIKKTMEERYGVSYFSQSDNRALAVMTDPSRLPYYREFQKDPIAFIHKYFQDKPSLKELCDITGVGNDGVCAALDKFNCRDEVAFVFSTMEREVTKTLLQIKPDIKIETNTHKIITPYEIDIYLPEYKIGIECNPTSTHNSSVALLCFDENTKPTPKNYHKMKSDLAEQDGIFLFHLFGYEWKYKRDIIESMLRNLIGKNDTKIYARNTEVREVDSVTAVQFLNMNHRQGRVFSPVRLGLYDKKTGELVSLMTFGKLRRTMGMNKEASEEIWELTRFCNKINTSVVGGASKLFKHFVNNYHPKEIRSFSDRAHTRGNLYSTLGFKELRRSDASYVWIDLKTDRAFHRIHAQKHNIRRFLNDYTIDIDNQTEFQIMESHGFVSLFDSGTITWEWKSQ